MNINKIFKKIDECTLLHRITFLMWIPLIVSIPTKIFILKQHCDNLDILTCCLGTICVVVRWKDMKWKELLK